jgi:glycosyltransferase involved in cell wall biosynthesis
LTEENSYNSPTVDIAIPCYDANGRGEEALEYAFKSIKSQTYKNYKIIIADHSKKGEEGVWRVCNDWRNILPISYYKNNRDFGNASSNFNFLFSHCTGNYIKPLCQDDFFLSKDSLGILAEEFSRAIKETGCNWMVSSYYHARDERDNLESIHVPYINSLICLFNTIGAPSGIIFKGLHDLTLPKFDVELS